MDKRQPETVTIGRVAFEAYAAATSGRTHDGQSMPAWEELSDITRAAWGAAAHAAKTTLTDDEGFAKARFGGPVTRWKEVQTPMPPPMSEPEIRLAPVEAAPDPATPIDVTPDEDRP